jgi:hypothetical protein
LAAFASSLVAANFGIAVAANIPIITITKIVSIIVNACAGLLILLWINQTFNI